ncbi:HD domain-containing protein [Nocardia otitidiscaviarum]|uniref:HD domain-containing protein n=1 Tax=Nocardia otitidiscaviarum TaxID=1823 RepID=UPI001894D6ED|nr:HD domain-containing protein [Nocardia otitidiscaviarum]MBF6182640.1 HD domain-containing protein [Nocardia otitidiscaviarum]
MSLALPATPLAEAANQLMFEALEPHLCHHSLRGFFFGRALAAAQGLTPGRDYDEETMFLICVLHDIGLAERANGTQRFEMDGADYAAQWLEGQGVTDERVDIIWDAIAAHTTGLSSSPVYRRRRPAEIWISVSGIGIDVGGGPDDLPPGLADAVHAAYPRLGGTRALTESIAKQVIANPRKAPPGSLAGEILRLRHPELVPFTWDTVLDTSGWRD